MKPVGVLLLLVLLVGQVNVAHAQYPRHVDPAQYELVEPDPDMLFLLYHDIYLGMLLENMTIQDEWLQWAMEVYSTEELTSMFEEYGDQLRFEGDNLNLTRFYFDEAMQYIGKYNLPAARSSFFHGLVYLEQSNATIPVLRGSTSRIGARLRADPAILFEDLDGLQAFIDEYAEFAQLLVDLLDGKDVSDVDLEKIKDAFEGVVDDALLKELQDYLDNLGGTVDLGSVTQTQLSLDLNASSAWVGSVVQVSGKLTANGVGLPGRMISITLGDRTATVSTDDAGFYVVDMRVPYVYEESLEIRAFYWPRADDSKIYSPATASATLFLLYNVPELKLSYPSSALPGRLWNISGVLSHENDGLSEFDVELSVFGGQYAAVTDDLGGFRFDVQVPVDVPLGSVSAFLSSKPSGVYSGVSKSYPVTVIQLPLSMEVDSPDWVLSGFLGRVRVSLTADGLPVNQCELRLVSPDDTGVVYSVNGVGSVGVAVPLFRLGGDYDWRLVADPAEPWIGGASLSGGFYVVNTIAVMFSAVCVAVLAYYVRRYSVTKKGRVKEPLELVEPIAEPVAEPLVARSFSGLFQAALRIVERLSGVAMAPSDTLREYLTRVLSRFSGRFADLFSELVSRYELWLYGRPHEVELGEVEVLVSELEEDHDEG